MRVVIVDDEPLARDQLREVLATDLGVQVVAMCGTAAEARAAIREQEVDALFMDIEMPGMSGLELARETEAAGGPSVVFVTAHQKYALDAYDVAPIDYVLKPADASRCRRALTRIARVIGARTGRPLPTHDASATSSITRVFVKCDDRLIHVPVGEIDAIEALGNYVKLRAGKRVYVLRASIAAMESRLDPKVFARTHRSFIVNVTRIRELIPVSHGDFTIVLERSGSVPLSRVYRDRLEMYVLPAISAAHE